MIQTDDTAPGLVVLFGSGETSASGRKIFDRVFQTLPLSPRVALLETPAGFELNSSRVIGRVGDFIEHRLQNYRPQLNVVPARARGTPFSPDNPEILQSLLDADMIFMGPGSPTYAVRQLRDSIAWQMLLARHRLGAAIALASAATIAVSTYALPVYEIYKVGEDLQWKSGLDLFGLYGLPLVFIPHWNNNDGGDELDTSRCFMGKSRFIQLMELLPADLTVIGLDEKTGLIMDMSHGKGQVIGVGGVTLIHTGHDHNLNTQPGQQDSDLIEVAMQRFGHVHYYSNGHIFPLSECCTFQIPEYGAGLRQDIWQQALETQARLEIERTTKEQPAQDASPPSNILRLVEERQAARLRKDWSAADQLRDQIAYLGWSIVDSPEGLKIKKIEE
jgi:cyanophycinase-like exopeptidase